MATVVTVAIVAASVLWVLSDRISAYVAYLFRVDPVQPIESRHTQPIETAQTRYEARLRKLRSLPLTEEEFEIVAEDERQRFIQESVSES